MPKFSIIIPVYNVAPYLPECLGSILGENLKDYELCVVDDGSTDNSGDICEVYQKNFTEAGVGFKLMHQPNQGVSVARNNALDLADGEFIWFVDADDYILPGSLTYLYKAVSQSKCDTVFFGNNPFRGSGDIEYSVEDRDILLARHTCYCNPLMLFSRSIIEKHCLRFTVGMKMAEDLEFQYKYLLYCKKPVRLPYNLYFIRERENSASRSVGAVLSNWHGCRMLLDNMAYFMHQESGLNQIWMESRIAERLKSLLQSASLLKSLDRKDVQSQFNYYVRQYKNLGYRNICGGSLRLACMDVRLYFFMYKVLRKIRR